VAPFHLGGAGKQDVVFKVNVLVQVHLEIG
jgi:hypothetical protein